MANTYTQIYVHVVFSTKNRLPIMALPWRKQVHKYISGIITDKGQKSIIINGVADHVHLLIGLKPSIALSNLVREIKNNTSKYINKNKWVKGKFAWQEGFGAFSYSHSQIHKIYAYILNQEEHHTKISFKEEYQNLLEKFEIEAKAEYMFD